MLDGARVSARHFPRLGRSVAGRAVDQLAQDVRVACVARGLLDHVDVDSAQGHTAVVRVRDDVVELVARRELTRARALLVV